MSPNADTGWHQQALDLADQCTAMAKLIPSATTANKLYSAAYSLRWQVRWAQNHLIEEGAPMATD
jgi:hypothetical protein